MQEAALRRIEPDIDISIVPNAGQWVVYETPEIANQYLEEMPCPSDVRVRQTVGAATDGAEVPSCDRLWRCLW